MVSVDIGTEQKIRGGFLIGREDVSSDKPLRLRRRSLPNDESIYEQRYFYGRGVHVEINGEVKHFPKVSQCWVDINGKIVWLCAGVHESKWIHKLVRQSGKSVILY